MTHALALNSWWIDQLRRASRPVLIKARKQAKDIAAHFEAGTLVPKIQGRYISEWPDTPHLRELHDKGWSLRQAAAYLGITFQHLHKVLQGARTSASLLKRVSELPAIEEVAK